MICILPCMRPMRLRDVLLGRVSTGEAICGAPSGRGNESSVELCSRFGLFDTRDEGFKEPPRRLQTSGDELRSITKLSIYRTPHLDMVSAAPPPPPPPPLRPPSASAPSASALLHHQIAPTIVLQWSLASHSRYWRRALTNHDAASMMDPPCILIQTSSSYSGDSSSPESVSGKPSPKRPPRPVSTSHLEKSSAAADERPFTFPDLASQRYVLQPTLGG